MLDVLEYVMSNRGLSSGYPEEPSDSLTFIMTCMHTAVCALRCKATIATIHWRWKSPRK